MQRLLNTFRLWGPAQNDEQDRELYAQDAIQPGLVPALVREERLSQLVAQTSKQLEQLQGLSASQKRREQEQQHEVGQPHQPPPPPRPPPPPPPPRMSMSDLKLMQVVGAGSFGLVHLAKHVRTGAPVALKQIAKGRVLEGKQLPHVLSERNILAAVKSPFIVNLLGSFQDDHNLYLALDYVPGGELFGYMVAMGTLAEGHAKFYAAEIILAIEALHARHFAFRDLKPENVLIGSDGHLRLTDFGFAKAVPEGYRTFTLCGTPEYCAPEVILNQGHGLEADWWSVGVLVYEMLVGRAPFVDDDLTMLYAKIITGVFALPTHVSPACQDILRALLTQDPQRRLGGRGGAAEVRAHPWFTGVDWGALAARRIPAPYVPLCRGPFDSGNFEEVPRNNPMLRAPKIRLTEQQQKLFKDF